MTRYETVFILTPVLSETQVEEAVSKLQVDIKKLGGKVTNTENWGLKKLAYSIQLKKNGFYNLVEFEAPIDAVNKLELAFKRDERVLRFITVKLDKHGQAWADERRKRVKDTKKA